MDSDDRQEPIRVCFIAPKAYPLFDPETDGIFGGAEVDLYFLATELAKDKGFAVSFITADYGQERFQTIEGVRVIKSVDFKKNALSGAVRVWRAMKAANAEIYFHEAASWGTFLIALFCKKHKRAFIYRTASEREWDGTYSKEHYFVGKAFRWSLHNAAQTVVQNETDKENLKRTVNVSPMVFPNAHRLPVLNEGPRETILWVGRSIHYKRPELFIELAETTPNEQFTMVCQRATGDIDYEAMVARAEIIKNLEFIRRVPFREINSYFQRAKVLVNTSCSEGFPNTFIQACNSATPILSLKVDPDGFLERYNCGICCNGDSERLLEALRYMLEGNRFVEIGNSARRYAQENHDVRKIVEEYKALFAKII